MDCDAEDESHLQAHQRSTATDERFGRLAGMAILLVFMLGIGNFAMHKAVLESGHPLLGHVPWFVHLLGGRASLVTEFLLLLGALLLAAQGYLAWAWGYLIYSIVNAIAAWLILSRRV